MKHLNHHKHPYQPKRVSVVDDIVKAEDIANAKFVKIDATGRVNLFMKYKKTINEA